VINYLKNKSIFLDTLLNAMQEQIAVIDRLGIIRYVNKSYINFGIENGQNPTFNWIGFNYLSVCSKGYDSDGNPINKCTDGIHEVLSGKKDSYQSEYPCHSPKIKRWFRLHIARLDAGDVPLFIITHTDITELKLLERKLLLLSTVDPLTGLANRRSLNDFLAQEWKRSFRSKKSLSVLIIDIDFFKEYNDFYGHLKGDECLCLVSNVIKKYARRLDDLAARFGGEEFVLVLGETEKDDAIRLAQSLCRKIAALNIPHVKGKTLTVSIGVSAMFPDAMHDNTSYLSHADKALYEAKKNGRNRVEVFMEPEHLSPILKMAV
jgi:diguanylate cyclase (GGDEF)-like protein